MAVNRTGYDHAQQLIAAGRWSVDPHRGVVCGVKGHPFTRVNSWGYIQIKFGDPTNWRASLHALAHRVVWESVHGPIAADLTINHLNGVKTDNRLANLDVVTLSANVTHAYATGLHPRPEGRLLTADRARDIYRRCHAGERDTPLAIEYGVSRESVNNIRNGWGWAHATGHQARR